MANQGKRVLVCSGSALSFIAAAALFFTSDQARAAEAESAGKTDVTEVVVTAQKRTERLLDVPMSVSATSGEQLVAAGVGSTLDLNQITPGLVMTNIGTGFTPAIRGVSSSGTSSGDESNVALYIDDVYIGNTLAGFFDLPDVERVEILKGPQGTLFGRNATGGAIRVVTRAPSFAPHASLSLDYGFNFNEKKVTAYLTGPLSDSVAGSLSGSYRKSDGFVKGVAQNVGRTYGGANNYTYRGKLLFKPTDSFRATLSADTSKNDNQQADLATARGQNPFPGPGSVANTAYRFAGSTQPFQITKSHGASIDATWDPSGAVSARSITAYRRYNLDYQADLDRTNQAITGFALQAKQENFSQEINLFNGPEKTFSWLVGGFYYHSRAGNPYFTVFNGDAPASPVLADYNTNVLTNSVAGFADLTWNISQQLHATVGGRYTTETKHYHYADTVRAGGLANRDVSNKETWNSPTARAVIRYDFTEDSNIYVSLSNGFKSGVFNAFSAVPVPVSPEKIVALEVGAKARLSGGIILTAAGYGYNYTDIQVQAQTLFAGQPLLTLSNAASAKIRGLEVTAAGHVTSHLSVNAGVNWMPKANYADYRTASVTVPLAGPGPVVGVSVAPFDASGSRMIKAPKWTANLQATYTTEVMGGQASATVSEAYTGKFNWQPANLTTAPGYSLVNARVSWTDPSDRYTVSVWGTNLTKTVYSTYTSANVRGDTMTYNEPRQIGVGVAAKF